MKKTVIEKINKVLIWLLVIASIGVICHTTQYYIDNYTDNTSYTLNVTPKSN